MQDSYVRARGRRRERPFDFHSRRNTPDMPKAYRGRRLSHRHLRQPPRGPVDSQTGREGEGSVGRHFHHAPSVRAPLAESYVSIMRKMCRPLFHSARYLENRFARSADQSLVHDLHRPAERHRTEYEGSRRVTRHRCTGRQLAVTRNARRLCATGRSATACWTVSESSLGVKPRITETTPRGGNPGTRGRPRGGRQRKKKEGEKAPSHNPAAASQLRLMSLTITRTR